MLTLQPLLGTTYAIPCIDYEKYAAGVLKTGSGYLAFLNASFATVSINH